MMLHKFLPALFFMFFLANLGFTCQASMPRFVGGGNAFRDNDEFIVEYTINHETKDAQQRISPLDLNLHGVTREWYANLAARYFTIEKDVFVIGYEVNYFAARLLKMAIAIARLENVQAEQVSVRFFQGSSIRSKCHAHIRGKEGYPVQFVDPDKSHSKVSLSTSAAAVKEGGLLQIRGLN